MKSIVDPLLLLTHGCEIDKTNSDVFLVCRIKKVSQAGAKYQESLRTGKIRSTIYLGPVPGLPHESYADFRYMYRVLQSDIDAARNSARCVASMTVEGRMSLQEHLYRFHTRRFPGEPLADDENDI